MRTLAVVDLLTAVDVLVGRREVDDGADRATSDVPRRPRPHRAIINRISSSRSRVALDEGGHDDAKRYDQTSGRFHSVVRRTPAKMRIR